MRILERIKKRYFRLSLAIQQLILRPYLNIFPLAILAGFWMLWNQKSGLYAHTPKLILPVWRGIVHIGGTIMFIILFIFTVYCIGVMTAKHDEYNLGLAFTGQDLRNGCPVLIKKKNRSNNKGILQSDSYGTVAKMQRSDCRLYESTFCES